jgi:hypothetical protein
LHLASSQLEIYLRTALWYLPTHIISYPGAKLVVRNLLRVSVDLDGQDRSQNIGSSSPMQEDGNGEKGWGEAYGAHHLKYLDEKLSNNGFKPHTAC